MLRVNWANLIEFLAPSLPTPTLEPSLWQLFISHGILFSNLCIQRWGIFKVWGIIHHPTYTPTKSNTVSSNTLYPLHAHPVWLQENKMSSCNCHATFQAKCSTANSFRSNVNYNSLETLKCPHIIDLYTHLFSLFLILKFFSFPLNSDICVQFEGTSFTQASWAGKG